MPLVGVRAPVSSRMVVVLPEPDGPMIPRIDARRDGQRDAVDRELIVELDASRRRSRRRRPRAGRHPARTRRAGADGDAAGSFARSSLVWVVKAGSPQQDGALGRARTSLHAGHLRATAWVGRRYLSRIAACNATGTRPPDRYGPAASGSAAPFADDHPHQTSPVRGRGGRPRLRPSGGAALLHRLPGPGSPAGERGRGFSYRTADGATIRDGAVLRRIRALAVPPAWTDVWICPDPAGHLQATGRDARGRKQYRYHARWRARTRRRQVRAPDRLREGPAPDPDTLRRGPGPARAAAREGAGGRRPAARADAHPGRQRRVRAAQSLVRADDAREPPRDGRGDRDPVPVPRQVRPAPRGRACATAGWPRSSGVARTCPARSSSSTSATTACPHDVGSDDVNDYLREISGADVTAKDFRTWAGTVLAYRALRALAARRRRARGAAQRRRGGPADRRTAREHAGRRPTELRPSRDPRGLSRRQDRRRAPRGGRGAARPALRPGSRRGARGGVAAPGPVARFAVAGRPVARRPIGGRTAARVRSDPSVADDGLDPRGTDERRQDHVHELRLRRARQAPPTDRHHP